MDTYGFGSWQMEKEKIRERENLSPLLKKSTNTCAPTFIKLMYCYYLISFYTHTHKISAKLHDFFQYMASSLRQIHILTSDAVAFPGSYSAILSYLI